MGFELRFTDKKITAWGGMGLMKRMCLTDSDFRRQWRHVDYRSRVVTEVMHRFS